MQPPDFFFHGSSLQYHGAIACGDLNAMWITNKPPELCANPLHEDIVVDSLVPHHLRYAMALPIGSKHQISQRETQLPTAKAIIVKRFITYICAPPSSSRRIGEVSAGCSANKPCKNFNKRSHRSPRPRGGASQTPLQLPRRREVHAGALQMRRPASQAAFFFFAFGFVADFVADFTFFLAGVFTTFTRSQRNQAQGIDSDAQTTRSFPCP